jgi:plastocyanin
MDTNRLAIALKAACAAAVAMIAFSAPLADAGELAEVRIEKMAFEPQWLKIAPGTTVKWTNNEKRTSHSVRFQPEDVPESDRLFPGESWQRTFDRPGTYKYICGPHPEMIGIIEVAP